MDLRDERVSRAWIVDVLVKPRSGYPWRDVPVEAYVALPMGLSFPRSVHPTRFGPSLGLAPGPVGGVTYFPTRHLGINVELGYAAHLLARRDPVGSGMLLLQQVLTTVSAVFACDRGRYAPSPRTSNIVVRAHLARIQWESSSARDVSRVRGLLAKLQVTAFTRSRAAASFRERAERPCRWRPASPCPCRP